MIASTHQVLTVWQQLEDAYFTSASFGGDTAEIYFYLLLPYLPGYIESQGDHNATIHGDRNCLVDRQVIQDFSEIFHLFSEMRECNLIIDGVDLDDWEPELVNFHRVHVKVVPWGDEEDAEEEEAE